MQISHILLPNICLLYTSEYYSKNSSTITVHIRHLREKLKDTSDTPQYIKTIWGVAVSYTHLRWGLYSANIVLISLRKLIAIYKIVAKFNPETLCSRCV